MIVRRFLRLSLCLLVGLIALAAIGAALGRAPFAQAAPAATFTYPGCGPTLQACIDLANNGDTIVMVPGSYTESVTVRRSITLTSVLPTTTLHAAANQRVMTVTKLAVSPSGPLVTLDNLTLDGGSLSPQSGCQIDCVGGGVLVTDTAQVRLSRVTIVNNQALRGGGVYIASGGVVMIDGSIQNNHAFDFSPTLGNSGGGVYVAAAGSTFELDTGRIAFNTAYDGGGVFVQDGKFVQTGGEVVANSAINWGGGVLIANASAAGQLQAGGILTNTAQMMGGGVFVDAGTVIISGTQIAGNAVVGTGGQIGGGGVAVRQGSAQVYQLVGSIDHNSAPDGGGYYIVSGTVTLNGLAQILHNEATRGSGGGAYLATNQATLTQWNGHIADNQALGGNGGGVAAVNGLYTLYNGDVSNNSAVNGNGGGVSAGSSVNAGTLHLFGGFVYSNTAATGGGVSVSGTGLISGGVILNNVATSQGGGVAVGIGQLILQDGQISGNSAPRGGGLYLQTTAAQLYGLGGVVADNHAPNGDGGGLLIDAGRATISGGQYARNDAYSYGGGVASNGTLSISGPTLIVSNTSNSELGGGGGVALLSGQATLGTGVIISGNKSLFGPGGGLYSTTPLMITGVKFIGNVAQIGGGGGTYLGSTGDTRIVNSLFARNAANFGAGLSLNSTGPTTLLYLTVADIITNPGSAIYLNSNSVGMTDTIVTSHSIGLAGNGWPVIEDYNLYFGNSLSVTNAISGAHDLDNVDPRFVDPAHDVYRLRSGSPAVDSAIDAGVDRDLGGWPRPIGPGFDRGAFELQALGLPIGGNLGVTLVYTSNTGTTTSVSLPPSLVTTATRMIFTNLVDVPPDTPPLPQYSFAGSVFEIEAFGAAGAIPGITFTQPITIVIHYSAEDVAGLNAARLKLYRYEHPPFGTDWCAIGVCRPQESQTLDLTHNTLRATVYGFSRWGKMGGQYAYEVFLPVMVNGQ